MNILELNNMGTLEKKIHDRAIAIINSKVNAPIDVLKTIDSIVVFYTPKKDTDLETFLCYYPIVTGEGSGYVSRLTESSNDELIFSGIMKANVEYKIQIRVLAFSHRLTNHRS